MSSTVKRNLIIPRGASYNKLWVWTAGKPVRLPVDLTGCTAELFVYAREKATTPIAAWTTTSGHLSLGGAAGSVALDLDRNVVDAIDWEKGFFKLFITFTGSPTRTRKLIEGIVQTE